MKTEPVITLAELEAALNAPRIAMTLDLEKTLDNLDDDEKLEVAAESDECGPRETIECMLEALRVRHADDETTQAILAAVQHLHLPALADLAAGL